MKISKITFFLFFIATFSYTIRCVYRYHSRFLFLHRACNYYWLNCTGMELKNWKITHKFLFVYIGRSQFSQYFMFCTFFVHHFFSLFVFYVRFCTTFFFVNLSLLWFLSQFVTETWFRDIGWFYVFISSFMWILYVPFLFHTLWNFILIYVLYKVTHYFDVIFRMLLTFY